MMGYVATFGAPQRDDLLYEAVSEGRRHPGMEHWLPLFGERMDTLFDYLDGAPVAIEPQARTPRANASSRSRTIMKPAARRWSIPAVARSTSRLAARPAVSDGSGVGDTAQ